MGTDWFRNVTWDANTALRFDERIARARRGWKKWQYFDIQAGLLASCGFTLDAIALYRRALVEAGPLEPSWRRVTLAAIGRILAEQGHIEEARRTLEEAVRVCSLADAKLVGEDEEEPEAVLARLKTSRK